jgi:phage tail P2-like protein
MFDIEKTMLPVTSTPLAKALDILEERLFALPLEMITKDPQTVSVGLLDHLAWEASVDVWDVDWPEDIKRDVVAMAAEIHQFKGTPFAIRRALEVLNLRTELVEWWQDEPAGQAGTFRVTAYAGRALYSDEEVFVNERTVRAVIAIIERTAPVSRGFSVLVGARLSLPPIGVGVGASAVGFTRCRMTVVQKTPRLPSGLATAGHASAISVTRGRIASN